MQIPSRVATAVLLAATGLLALVVIVGLIRNQVDTQATLVALAPIITGIIVGSAVSNKKSNDSDESNKSGGS